MIMMELLDALNASTEIDTDADVLLNLIEFSLGPVPRK